MIQLAKKIRSNGLKKLKKSKRRLILSVLLLISAVCLSTAQAEVIIVENNGAVTADISATEATRIAVADDRITLVRGAANAYTISNDTVQGAVFIKPILASHSICHSKKEKSSDKQNKKIPKKYCTHLAITAKPFYLFVSIEQGRNYILHLTPQLHHAAELLVLKPLEAEKAAALAWEKSDRYTQTLIRLLTGILNKQMPPGYVATALDREFTFDSQVRLHLAQRWTGNQLIAESYQVTNHSRQPLSLREKDFYQPNDRAIFLKKSTLAPDESTALIKVRSHS